MTEPTSNLNRRTFLQAGAAGLAAASLTALGRGRPGQESGRHPAAAAGQDRREGHHDRPGRLPRRVPEDEKDAVRLIQRAVDEGITFLDNAWDYMDGKAEDRMGKAISQGGRRDKVFLMTKCCGRTAKDAQSNLEDSLRRLKTDHLDLWQFHEINYDNDPDWVFEPGGALEYALKAKEQGKVRFLGFTGHKHPEIHLKMLTKPFDWATVQMPLNVLDSHFRSFQHLVLPVLEQPWDRPHRHEEPGRPRQHRHAGQCPRRRRPALRPLAAHRHAGLRHRLGEGARPEPQDRPRIPADDEGRDGRRWRRGTRRSPATAASSCSRSPRSSTASRTASSTGSRWVDPNRVSISRSGE